MGSRITKIQITNFMSILDATIEFDERGIILLKGYNDSGKTAILTALDILFYDRHKRKRVGFINDDDSVSYARIAVFFDDGVFIIRDLLKTGQSAYHMYQGETKIYSTLQNGVYTQIDEIPEVIAEYLGVAKSDDIYLNSRSNKDPLLLAETKGGENYKFVGDILHSDELVLAAKMLNTDKNKAQADLNSLTTERSIKNKELASLNYVNDDMVTELEKRDESLNTMEKKLSSLDVIITKKEELDSLVNIPNLETVSIKRLQSLTSIVQKLNMIGDETVIPNLRSVDTEKLNKLSRLLSLFNGMSEIEEVHEIPNIDTNRVRKLQTIMGYLTSYKSLCDSVSSLEEQIKQKECERIALEKLLTDSGYKLTKCNNCGNLVAIN